MAIKHTHTRKPEPVTTWVDDGKKPLPKWLTERGVDRAQLQGRTHAVLIHRNEMITLLTKEEFEELYD